MPRFLEILARAQADSPQTLAEALEGDMAGGARSATLVSISPDAASPRFLAFLEEWGFTRRAAFRAGFGRRFVSHGSARPAGLAERPVGAGRAARR